MGGGAECPQKLLTGKFLTYWEKRGKEKWEDGAEKKENRKRGGGIFLKRRIYKMSRGPFLFFFFFCFSLFKTIEICFGSIKMGIFYWEKAFHGGKKSGKMTLPPLKKYPSYTPASHFYYNMAHPTKTMYKMFQISLIYSPLSTPPTFCKFPSLKWLPTGSVVT